MARVKLEPVRLRQVRRVKSATPLVKTPRACADPNFLLIGQIQSKRKLIQIARCGKMSMQSRLGRVLDIRTKLTTYRSNDSETRNWMVLRPLLNLTEPIT